MNPRIILIEGIPGIGKSTLIDGLIRKHISLSNTRQIRTFLHLTQAHTYGPLAPDEDTNTLTTDKNLKHLEKIVTMLEWVATSSVDIDKTVFYCLIDTLHLTHVVRPGILNWEDIQEFDARLKNIGCKLIFLRAKPNTIWDRTIQLRKNNQFITKYAKKYGNTHEEILQYFVTEQKKLESLIKKSLLTKLIINAEDDIGKNIERIYSFWKDI